MLPADLARRHPRLFHVTRSGTWSRIRQHGLLPASHLLDLFEISGPKRDQIDHVPRPTAVELDHPLHGTAVLTDQKPMSEAALVNCLDDGLIPADWLAILNRRVFFWGHETSLARLVNARSNRTKPLEVLVIDTLPLARAYADVIELSPINSGATIRKPARRGRSTFTPLLALSHDDWSRQRGGRDRILEVTVLGAIPDIARYILDIRCIARDA